MHQYVAHLKSPLNFKFKSIFKNEEFYILIFSTLIATSISSILLIFGVNANSHATLLINIQFQYTFFLYLLIGQFAISLIKERPESPVKFLLYGKGIRETVPRIISSIILLLAVSLLMAAFGAAKSAIPLFNNFTWDHTFIEWDRMLHGGDPWRILQPIFGYPIITSLLSYLYHGWFLLIFVGPACVSMHVKDRELRTRFFLGFLMTWTGVGIIAATSLASVGPVFLEPIIGDDYFREQMNYLNRANETHPVLVLDVQKNLLEWYEAQQYGLGRGITAMPSMHVALCMLYFLFAWELDKRLGWAFLAFMIFIMVGSVHLAYHYAVDGYVSVILTYLVWKATAPLAKRLCNIEQQNMVNQETVLTGATS